MASESSRKEFGMTDKGVVVVIGKDHFPDHEGEKFQTFEVRHGVRTVVEGVSQDQAEAVANALVGNLPPPVSSPAAAPSPAMEAEVEAVRAKVSKAGGSKK